MSPSTSPDTSEKVLILGCGVFGVSTALHFLQAGYKDVHIIDKSDVLPAVDAASTDLNKIIRAGDYADPELARLSVEAVEEWKKDIWEGCYHESGILLTYNASGETDAFSKACRANLPALGIAVVDLPNSQAIIDHFPPQVRPYLGDFKGRQGYWNPCGGWAEAARAVEVGMKMVRQLGCRIEGGKAVKDLLIEDGRCRGVVLEGGERMDGYDLVVVAMGSWTPSVLPEHVAHLCTATGQIVAKTQLFTEEEEIYSQFPVVLDFEDGAYTFPPNHQGIVKSAVHGKGYLNFDQVSPDVSVPRTVNTPGAHEGFIPREGVYQIRNGLRRVYPQLAERDFIGTRLCWYSDTENGEWIIDRHQTIGGLIFATGGSGHAFKFLPLLGSYVLQRHLGTLPESLAAKFSISSRIKDEGADHRPSGEERKILRVEELANHDDLLANAKSKL